MTNRASAPPEVSEAIRRHMETCASKREEYLAAFCAAWGDFDPRNYALEEHHTVKDGTPCTIYNLVRRPVGCFHWAMDQVAQGRAVFRPSWDKRYWPGLTVQLTAADTVRFFDDMATACSDEDEPRFQLDDMNATDWEVVTP